MPIILLALVLLSMPAAAQGVAMPGDPGYVSGAQEGQKAGLQEQIANAQDGDAGSQYNLGMKYATGQGVPQDYALALKWLEMAGEQGDVDAQAAAGVMHQKGQGTNADDHAAMMWYKRAAEQGDRMSQFNLATLLANGKGSMKDEKEAFFWSILADTMGDPKASSLHDLLKGSLPQADVKAIEARAAAWQPTVHLDAETEKQLETKPGPINGDY